MTRPTPTIAGVAIRHLDGTLFARRRGPAIIRTTITPSTPVRGISYQYQNQSTLKQASPSLRNAQCHTTDASPRSIFRDRQYSTTRTTTSSGSNGDGPNNNSNSNTKKDEKSLIDSPPDLTSHYTIFSETLPRGPPPAGKFSISLPKLKREFLRLQASAHPDKYPPGIQKQKAEALSARINEAYRALSDPLARAQYILESQYGVDVTSETGGKKHPQDSELLMYVMEIQEAIEDAPDESTIEGLKGKNNDCIEECIDNIAEAFDAQEVERATKECVKLRFLYSVQHGLKEWEPGRCGIRLQH